MTFSIKLHVTFLMTLAAALLPLISFAHIPHPDGAPPHPTDSADYHDIESVASVGNTTVDARTSDLSERVAMLLELVALLQQQLALMTGGTSAVETETNEVTSQTGQINTVGSLVMTTDSTYRYFSSDGMPEYDISGNRYTTDPSEQDHDYRVPLNPEKNSSPTYYNIPFTFGIALNGVTFEPFAAEWYQDDRASGWQEDPFVTLRGLDEYNAHVQPTGLYHYHSQPTNLLEGDANGHSPVIGFAADGFPVYGPWVYEYGDAYSDVIKIDSSYQLKNGSRPSGPGGSYDGTYNEDYEYMAQTLPDYCGEDDDCALPIVLDECNGRYGATPEFTDGTHYYVATESFPYLPRCLMGDMDNSFVSGPPQR